jgi:hypothetical protein
MLSKIFGFVATLAVSALPVSAAVISSYDNGSYNHNGIHSGGNTNSFTGVSGSFPTIAEYRSFYAFDLSGQQQASAISITFIAHGTFHTDTGSETVGVYDYLGAVDALVGGAANNVTGLPRYNDLGGGALLGQYTLTAANGTAMPEFTIDLSTDFVDLYNAALLGNQKIALGAALLSLEFWAGNQGFWGGAAALPSARLNITEAAGPVAAEVSVPASFGLFGAGLLALVTRSRKKIM